MDEWLDERGLYRKNTALDATCLFRAVAEQILPADSINGHQRLRKLCVNYLKQHREEFESKICGDFDEYVVNLAAPKGWGTVLELEVISRIFRVDFLAYFGPDPPIQITQNNFKRQCMLCVTGTCFYDAIYTKLHIQNLGFCQSIIYKILYENVFKVTDLDYAVSKMLHDKAARAQRERYLNQQQLTGNDFTFDTYVDDYGTPLNVRAVIDSGAILFPYKVAKALDPDIYRNVEFDNWVESQRGKPLLPHCTCVLESEVSRRNSFWFLSGGPLRVGVKCQVRCHGRIFTGYIHELSPDRGPAVVYVEEFAQKITVPYDDLIPLPRSAVKPDWSYSHKHQMISRLGPRANKDTPVDHRVAVKTRGRKSDSETSTSPTIVPIEHDSTVSSQSNSSKSTNHSLIYTLNDSISKWSIVNKNADMSIYDDFSDLPLDDLPTLRFFYNMGIEYFHKGTYVKDDFKFFEDSAVESPLMVQVCQGAPLIHPPPQSFSFPPNPSNMILPSPPPMVTAPPPPLVSMPPPPIVSGPPPPMPVCPSSPMLPCPPMAYNTSTPIPTQPLPVYSLPPVQEAESPPQRAIDSTPNTREGKERGRNQRFNKPPRFQRLESAKAAQKSEVHNEELQNPEVSSTSMEPQLPVAVVPPFQVANPFVFDPENPEQIGYVDAVPYPEYPAMVQFMDQRMYVDGENNYQYVMLPHVPVYF